MQDVIVDSRSSANNFHVFGKNLAFGHTSVNEHIPQASVHLCPVVCNGKVQLVIASGGVGVFGQFVILHT